MLLSALFVGALTTYYFGVRAGCWAAAVTFAVCIVALIVPRLAMPLYLALAGGTILVQQIGSRRPRPPDAVLAVGLVRRAVERAWARLRGRRD